MSEQDWVRKAEDSGSDLEIDRQLKVDNTKKKGWSAKQKLIKLCQNEVGTYSSGKRPMNIAIIGPPGCGKSSLLNTIFASFSDEKWRSVAKHGCYGQMDKQVSQRLISFNKKKYYTREGQNSEDDEILMPTFIDMSGFEDLNNDFSRELLNIVFYGRLNEYDKIKDVLDCFNKDGVNGLQRKYGQGAEYLVVDRIIFVCSGDPAAPLPTDLMECVSKVSNAVREIPVFGVMTKADIFDATVNIEVEKREKKFREHLGIPLERFTRIKNYCEDIDKKMDYRYSLIPKIDVAILELMTQVFSKFLEVANPEGRIHYPERNDEVLNESKEDAEPVPLPPKYLSGINFSILLILITIQVLLVAVILQFGTRPIITDEKVNTICANYEFIRSKHNATIDGLSELCEHKVDILNPPIYLLIGAIMFVIVVPQIMFNFFFATSRT